MSSHDAANETAGSRRCYDLAPNLELSRRASQVQSANPSFVALDPSRRFLYVINEIDDYEGQKSGSVEAYAIDPNTGMIKLLI
jgi:6-phosphogluconolactonase (cycloisomerase 2 family)